MSLVAFDLPSTGTTQRRLTEFPELPIMFEERYPLATVQSNFLQNQHQPRHGDIEYTKYTRDIRARRLLSGNHAQSG